MDVELKPGVPGCIGWTLTIMTLGVYALLMRQVERGFPQRLEADAIVTRGGKRIRWAEVTRVTTVRFGSETGPVTEYLVHSPSGRVSLHQPRMRDPATVMAFFWAHLPPQVTEGRP